MQLHQHLIKNQESQRITSKTLSLDLQQTATKQKLIGFDKIDNNDYADKFALLQKYKGFNLDIMTDKLENLISSSFGFELSTDEISEILQVVAPFLQNTELLLSFGGDDRLTVDGNLMNKYLSSTYPRPDVIRRGSCTCSTISTDVSLSLA